MILEEMTGECQKIFSGQEKQFELTENYSLEMIQAMLKKLRASIPDKVFYLVRSETVVTIYCLNQQSVTPQEPIAH